MPLSVRARAGLHCQWHPLRGIALNNRVNFEAQVTLVTSRARGPPGAHSGCHPCTIAGSEPGLRALRPPGCPRRTARRSS
jgi:hypothetical protein